MAKKFDKSKSKLFSRGNPNMPKYIPRPKPEYAIRMKQKMEQQKDDEDLFIKKHWAEVYAIIKLSTLLLLVILFIQLFLNL